MNTLARLSFTYLESLMFDFSLQEEEIIRQAMGFSLIKTVQLVKVIRNNHDHQGEKIGKT